MSVAGSHPNAPATRGRAFPGARRAVLALASIVLVVAGGSAASEAARSASTFPGGAYFNLACGFSHMNNDDPILFPGEPGRSHNHTYVGNRTVHAFSTPATLRHRGETTCELDDDLSTYWVPTLYVGTTPVIPYAGVAYYVKLVDQRLSPFPADLRIVAGNASARKAQKKTIVSWSCGGIGTSKKLASVPVCSRDDTLELRVTFPNCWNGRTSDSSNHRSHMAYAAGARCPSTHPVAVPSLILVLLYPPVVRGAAPASGKFGAHADFMNGWDDGAFSRLVAGLNVAQPSYP